jgi:cytochrome d ubiquinol oxidase subunit I
VVGIDELQSQLETQFGPGDYIPNVRLVYWSMRVMAYLGTLSFLVALWGAWVLWRARLVESRWFLRGAVAGIFFPFVAGLAGWVLTEAGRQPWLVYGQLKTADAVTPTNATWTVALSLAIFVALYGVLTLVDIWLMRRYARLDLPELDDDLEESEPTPAPSY